MGKGRAPCCEKVGLKKGSWTPAEDMRLITYIRKYGHGNWRALPKQAGLLRCGKSCRLRWINYLRPDIKRGNFTKEEEDSIIELHQRLGNKWSKIASHLPGRTDNEIKNVWNTHLKKRLGAQDKPSEERIQPPTSPSTSSQFNPQNRNSTSPSEEPQQQTIGSKTGTPSNTTNDINEIATFPSLDMWDILDSSSSPNPNTKHVPSDKNMIVDQKDTSCSSSPNSSITHYTTLNQTQPHHSINNTNIRVDLDDVWDMLDDSSNVGLSTTTKGDNSWIEYLERELDLWSTSNYEEPHVVQPPQISNWCDHGGTMDATIDPITSYFDHNPPTLPSSIHF